MKWAVLALIICSAGVCQACEKPDCAERASRNCRPLKNVSLRGLHLGPVYRDWAVDEVFGGKVRRLVLHAGDRAYKDKCGVPRRGWPCKNLIKMAVPVPRVTVKPTCPPDQIQVCPEITPPKAVAAGGTTPPTPGSTTETRTMYPAYVGGAIHFKGKTQVCPPLPPGGGPTPPPPSAVR